MGVASENRKNIDVEKFHLSRKCVQRAESIKSQLVFLAPSDVMIIVFGQVKKQ